MLIAWIAARFGISTLLSTVILYGLLTGVVLIGWHFVAEHYRDQGRAEIQAKWDKAVRAEEDRVAKAVAEAQAEAQKTIDALEQKEEELNAELIALAVDAAHDPNAGRVGIGRDSVRRIGRIR